MDIAIEFVLKGALLMTLFAVFLIIQMGDEV